MSSVKGLVDSGLLKTVPSKYAYHIINPLKEFSTISGASSETIPTIDFSLLSSGTLDQRFKIIQALRNACQDWGFFMVINHGVSKSLRKDMLRLCGNFFELPEEEKQKYRGTKPFAPIRYGTSFNVSVDKALFWRDYLKIHIHPHFAAPTKPPAFSEVIEEYSKRTREVASELLKAISISLGLEENYIIKKMEVENGSQLLVVNLYPPCPQPEITMGLPSHSDHGLLTLLMQNHLGGLQVMHNGKWVPVNPPPDAFVVNIGDHMEILSNGKYKSVLHRAAVNNKGTRISIGTAHGPPFETVVSPVPELANPQAYRGITYKDYLKLQQSSQLDGKSCLDKVRL